MVIDRWIRVSEIWIRGETGDEAGRLKDRERSSFWFRCRDFGEGGFITEEEDLGYELKGGRN